MKEERFNVLQSIRDFIIAIDKNLDNFPKKDIELKNRIRTNTYDILEIAYEANSTQDFELKKVLIVKIAAKVKIIDFLINLSCEKNLIPYKRYTVLGNKLGDIEKYMKGWQDWVYGARL